jgi:hypothetical protein
VTKKAGRRQARRQGQEEISDGRARMGMRWRGGKKEEREEKGQGAKAGRLEVCVCE